MYLPIFIAILLGLVSAGSTTINSHRGTTYINPSEPVQTYSSLPPDSTGIGGGPGDNGHVPPPRPKP
ncbi:hypothetical protein [Pedobacter sp. UBA4863]|uniref:hypothetical protein n=1 Tax=Pedobacter sp. UBA4863 TaxID=1947060 RepID=UPI0025D359F6|nr:hypothetical protein [Pedobacter sp. UBA4863]